MELTTFLVLAVSTRLVSTILDSIGRGERWFVLVFYFIFVAFSYEQTMFFSDASSVAFPYTIPYGQNWGTHLCVDGVINLT